MITAYLNSPADPRLMATSTAANISDTTILIGGIKNELKKKLN